MRVHVLAGIVKFLAHSLGISWGIFDQLVGVGTAARVVETAVLGWMFWRGRNTERGYELAGLAESQQQAGGSAVPNVRKEMATAGFH